MATYEKPSIKLEEAMTLPIPQKIRVWSIPGLHVKVATLPKETTVQKTLVMKTINGNFMVSLQYTTDVFDLVLKCSSLQELQNKMPELFEVHGHLEAFC